MVFELSVLTYPKSFVEWILELVGKLTLVLLMMKFLRIRHPIEREAASRVSSTISLVSEATNLRFTLRDMHLLGLRLGTT